MRKILFLISFLIVLNCAKGQTNYTPSGIWKYINGNDTIEVFFKTNQISVGGGTQTVVLGFHKYVKNGSLIESRIDYSNTNFADKMYSWILFDFVENDVRNDGTLKDITLNTDKYLIVKKVDPNTMNITITSKQSYPMKSGYTLPRNFQLTKF